MNIDQKNPPKFCLTAAGFLIHEGKILLIKHKKLSIWLPPGGHIDDGEQIHHAAEREFWEETGLEVEAIDFITAEKQKNLEEVDYFPRPFSAQVHWISKENYEQRLASDTPDKEVSDNPKWQRGCERHVGYVYLVKLTNGVKYRQNVEETDGISWFSLEEAKELETFANIKREVKLAFKYATELEKRK